MTERKVPIHDYWYDEMNGEVTPSNVPVSFFKRISNLRPHISTKNGVTHGNIDSPEILNEIEKINQEAHMLQLKDEVNNGHKYLKATAVLGGILFVAGMGAAAEIILRDSKDINNVTHLFQKNKDEQQDQ